MWGCEKLWTIVAKLRAASKETSGEPPSDQCWIQILSQRRLRSMLDPERARPFPETHSTQCQPHNIKQRFWSRWYGVAKTVDFEWREMMWPFSWLWSGQHRERVKWYPHTEWQYITSWKQNLATKWDVTKSWIRILWDSSPISMSNSTRSFYATWILCNIKKVLSLIFLKNNQWKKVISCELLQFPEYFYWTFQLWTRFHVDDSVCE